MEARSGSSPPADDLVCWAASQHSIHRSQVGLTLKKNRQGSFRWSGDCR